MGRDWTIRQIVEMASRPVQRPENFKGPDRRPPVVFDPNPSMGRKAQRTFQCVGADQRGRREEGTDAMFGCDDIVPSRDNVHGDA